MYSLYSIRSYSFKNIFSFQEKAWMLNIQKKLTHTAKSPSTLIHLS